ncbi:MAG: hypothetical protein AAGB93_01045 [Planctomycetota bacterium]
MLKSFAGPPSFVAPASLAVAALVTAPSAAAQMGTCTQSTDNMQIIAQNSVACVQNGPPQVHVDNSYWRRYDAQANCGSAGLNINAVTFGIEAAQSGPNGNGEQPANVRIYTIASGDPLLIANLTQVADEPIMIFDQVQALFTAPLSSQVVIPPGFDCVVELFLPDGVVDENIFFIGSNDLGESAPSYLSAAGCGITEPTTTTQIGFPTMGIILDLVLAVELGNRYCTPGNPNNNGTTGVISAVGSSVAANNDLTLTASSVTTMAFGYFLTSTQQAFIPNPAGSQGNLCLTGAIGRYVGAGQIQNSGANGEFSLTLDLTQTPSPTGFVSIMAGDTYNFQAWHRDLFNGAPTSNFTDAIEILFL